MNKLPERKVPLGHYKKAPFPFAGRGQWVGPQRLRQAGDPNTRLNLTAGSVCLRPGLLRILKDLLERMPSEHRALHARGHVRDIP